MLKIAAVISLMLVGSTLWAAGLSCDSCGSECASACGTRHFRACCFNYLRRKRLPSEVNMPWTSKNEIKMAERRKMNKKIPIFAIEDVPEPWVNSYSANDFDLYPVEDSVENRLPMRIEA